ncbi:MAG: HAMP domain-containing protein [Candidatus Schekmanbacteria bacterium]|nr:HAMP domain-containing protein [Candidatus Schekmanbacteria bacterium]
MRPSRLAIRLIGAVVAILFLIFGGTTVLLIEESRGELGEKVEAYGRLAVRLIQGPPPLVPAGELGLARERVDWASHRVEQRLQELLAVLGRDSPILAIALREPHGKIIAGARLGGGAYLPALAAEPHLAVRGEYLDGGVPLAEIEVLLDLGELDRVLIATRHKTVRLVFIETVLMAVLLFIFLGSRVLRPVGSLVHGINRIRDGDLLYRVPVTTDDELGDLARSFNRMAERLRAARDAQEARTRDLVAAYDALKRTQDRLIASEKLSSVGRLAAGVAHEIGNPLSSILGYAEVLLMDEADNERKSYLERVRSEVERIARIVRDLLDFSRPSAVAFEAVQLAEVLDRTLDLASHHSVFRKITVHRDYRSPDATVWGSSDQLQQVFINLCLNAALAMDDGGNLRVRLWREAAHHQLVVEVQDDGCGMAQETLRQIFDPFFTTRAPGEGTGLGLAICHTIVERHRGAIEVDSSPGIGTLFRVVLPQLQPGTEVQTPEAIDTTPEPGETQRA